MIKNGEEITSEMVGTYIEGYNPMKHIVNIEYKYQNNQIKILYRNDKDQKCTHYENFYPFVWAKLSVCQKMLESFNGTAKEKRAAFVNAMSDAGIAVIKLDTRDKTGKVQPVMEDGYCFKFYAVRPMSQTQFNNFFKRVGTPISPKKKKGDEDKIIANQKKEFLQLPPKEQYMVANGIRFFKGSYDYNDLLRMVFDLETQGLDPKRHRIKLNGIRLNRPITINGKTFQNFERIFRITGKTKEEQDKSELEIIDTMLRIIYTFKPDVITAHNGENFDWKFIMERCIQLGTTIEKMSAPYFNGNYITKNKNESVLKLGGEIEKFHQTIVPDTIVTDSLHAVRRFQAIDSSMMKSTLKYATQYAKMQKPNRVYVPGKQIDNTMIVEEEHFAFNDANGDWYLYDPNCGKPFVWDGKTERNFIPVFNEVTEGYVLKSGKYIVDRYLKDDLWECDKVEWKYNSTNFLICKMLPVPFQKCCTMGTAGQWKSLLLGWCYENNLAVPSFTDSRSFTGGLSRLLVTGFVEDVIKLDYNSLYPSIILTWAIHTTKDTSGVMLKMLEYVLTEREKYKELKKKAGKIVSKLEPKVMEGTATPEEIAEYKQACEEFAFNDKRQAQMKVLANSFFGSFGAPNLFPFGDSDCAERTTCTGRQALRLMISHFHNLGYQPIVGDTDGFNFKKPKADQYRYTEDNPYIGKGLSRETKEGEAYTGFEADVAEFNDTYMCDMHYADGAVNKMGLGIDEVVVSTINFSRKNYADYFPDKPFPEDVKLVGNTVKSKKMSGYIEKFLSKGIRLLLQGKGQEFLETYYNEIEDIYNGNIPVRDIASKGKIKKTIKEYLDDCQTLTSAGTPKSRQAWMELAIRDSVPIDVGDTLYYINTGVKKSDADIKRVTRYMMSDGLFGDAKNILPKIDKEWKMAKTLPEYAGKHKIDYIADKYPTAVKEEKIIYNSQLLSNDIIETDEDIFCEDIGIQYNTAMYIDKFNKRITPLLVCFSRDIREKILITNPTNRQYFTKEEAVLVCGQPNKPGDQDTYEQLMTMEDKEIKFWIAHPEWEIPFLKENGQDWEKIKTDYLYRMEEEKRLGVDVIKNGFFEAIANMTDGEYNDFLDEGKLPAGIAKIVEFDPEKGVFINQNFPDCEIGTIYDIIERVKLEKDDNEDTGDEETPQDKKSA